MSQLPQQDFEKARLCSHLNSHFAVAAAKLAASSLTSAKKKASVMTSQFPDNASLKSEIVVVKFTNFPPIKIEVANAKEALSPRLLDIEERCT